MSGAWKLRFILLEWHTEKSPVRIIFDIPAYTCFRFLALLGNSKITKALYYFYLKQGVYWAFSKVFSFVPGVIQLVILQNKTKPSYANYARYWENYRAC